MFLGFSFLGGWNFFPQISVWVIFFLFANNIIGIFFTPSEL